MNNTWIVEYWPGKEIEQWIEDLSMEHAEAIAKELKLLQRFGNELRLPHSKALGQKLFELRERRYGYRIYYAFNGKQIIVLLAAGDKSTQKKDIKKAHERLNKLLKYGVQQ